MKISKCKHNSGGLFDGPLILEPEIYSDSRGSFLESWNYKAFNEIVGSKIFFLQDNQSISQRGVLRGMHYQKSPFGQDKLVRCTQGSVFDVIIDLRKKSNTFKNWAGINLNSKKFTQLWIPEGFAHGFLALESNTIFEYKVTNYWSNDSEITMSWKDEDIQVKWPINYSDLIISKKDSEARTFESLQKSNEIF